MTWIFGRHVWPAPCASAASLIFSTYRGASPTRNRPPPRTTIWPYIKAYCRVQEGCVFLWARYPCRPHLGLGRATLGFDLTEYIDHFLESQLPHKIVNLLFTVTDWDNKLTILWGSGNFKNHLIDTLCEISFCSLQAPPHPVNARIYYALFFGHDSLNEL